jgi:hypothetical protein
MNDIYVQVKDATAGDDFLPLDEWLRQECVATAGNEMRRILDQAGATQKIRREEFGRLDALAEPAAQKLIDRVHDCLAAGTSLDEVGAVLGARLVRAPRFELGTPSLQTWAEITAIKAARAVVQWCNKNGLNERERKNVIEYATKEIKASIRDAIDRRRHKRDRQQDC